MRWSMAAVCLVPFAIVAQAQQVELSTTRCKQFAQLEKNQQTMIVTWLVGYYTEEKDSDVVDPLKIQEAANKIADFCVRNPSFTLSSAAEGLLGK